MLKKIVKLTSLTIMLLIILVSTNKLYARNAEFYALGMDENGELTLRYRTFTSAGAATQRKYKNEFYKVDGWAYARGPYATYANTSYLLRNTTSRGYFRSRYTYIHPNPNTDYIGSSGNYKYYQYVSDVSTDYPINGTTQSISSINGETLDYKGFYNFPAVYGQTGELMSLEAIRENGIYVMNQNDLLYRMRVNGSIYESDMYTSSSDYKTIYKMFNTQIKDKGYVYISEVTYSVDGSDYSTRGNMDTAYKFNKNQSNVWGMWNISISGGTNGLDSFINYYDNKLYIPRLNETTTIYVRHIDVTDQEYITRDVVNNIAGSSKFKKVGYATTKDNSLSYFSSYDPAQPQYQERFLLDDLDTSTIITVYNKLYSDITKTSTVGSTQDDNTDYSGYELVGTVTGAGVSMDEAIKNRDTKYDNFNELQVRQTVDVFGDNIGNYVVIDFLYKKQDPKVYIRHVDITGIENGDSKAISERAYTQAYSDSGRPIKDVGFATLGGNSTSSNKKIFNTSTGDSNREYEYYELSYDSLKQNNSIKFYNKLFDTYTKQSKLNNTRTDYTDYSNYEYVKCVSAQGYSITNAIENRDERIDKKEFSTYNTLDVINEQVAAPYVFIDFYYKRKSPPTLSPKILVRHINVSGMAKTTYRAMNSYVNNGVLGEATFDGNDAYRLSTSNRYIGKNKYNNSGNYYNEIYTSLTSNRYYTLYNEFYNDRDSDYEYIGYIIGQSNVDLYLAELARDNKIANADFSSRNPILDGGKGLGYASIHTGNNEFIVVDMYYKEKNTQPIKFAEKTGRIEFDAVKDEFKEAKGINGEGVGTNRAYDTIPSDEELYVSITNANKYFLGGIRVVPMKIENTQKVKITVNVPYKYYYKYIDDAICAICGESYDYEDAGGTCDAPDDCDCEEECDCTCDGSINYHYGEGSDSGTITKTFEYILPYTYDYYKISNMRVYKIDHMVLDDTENTTDLPLFDGNIHEIGMVQKNYYDSIIGSFAGSASSQTLTDDRSVASRTSYSASGTTSNDFAETVTVATVEFPQATYNDKFYTDSTAGTKRYKEIEPAVTSITNAITAETATTITGATTSGTLNHTTGNGPQVTFNVNSDKIKIGSEDMLASDEGERSNSKTIKLSEYKDTDENKENDEKVEVKIEYPSNIKKHYGFDTGDIDLRTSQDDFNKDALKIPMSRLNGERISKAEIYYKLLEDDALNFDASSTDLVDSDEDGFVDKKHGWTKNVATTSGSFKDTEMYDKEKGEVVETRVTTGGNLPLERTYTYESSKTSTSHGTGDVVNVFTPIKFKMTLYNGQTDSHPAIVDHTIGGQKVSANNERIQKGTRFTITITPENTHKIYGSLSNGISKYIKQYYIKFTDLDVEGIIINGNGIYNGGGSITANTWIGPIENIGDNTTISAIAKSNPNYASSVLEQETNQYVVRGVTMNATSLMLSDLASGRYSDDTLVTKSNEHGVDENNKIYGLAENSYSRFGTTNKLYHTKYYIKKKIYNDNNYVAETTSIPTINLSRVYDFKITDVKDLDWKDTFRKSTSTNTNTHSGISYYSGVNKLNIYSTTFNERIRRTTDEIGATSQRVLPIGPYKNTNTSYTYAPKLGYRFSFDFKTTGQIEKTKTAKITVSFMFVDKSKGLGPKDRLIENIDLYYKDSSNKYVKVGSPSDKMTLYFVPDDGYRLTFTENTYNFNKSNLSNKTIKLGSLTKLDLNYNMRAVSDNNFSQIWYGEYKLPNSTIAVKRGVTDLNKKLTNGYIAVKFNIEVTDHYGNNQDITIAYGQNDKATGSTAKPNTSQWDYEGYLGFDDPGSQVSESKKLTLRLDTGVYWDIDNDIYNKLKGTVMLYDVDAKASSDYN